MTLTNDTFSEETLDIYSLSLEKVQDNFFNKESYDFTIPEKIDLSILRNKIEQDYIRLQHMYKKPIECYGILHDTVYSSIVNPYANKPRYLLTDGGTIEGKQYFLCGIILDEDFHIHSIVNGYSHKEANMILHEEMSLMLSLDYLKNHHNIDSENLTWFTDITSGSAEKIIRYEGLDLSYDISNASSNNFQSGFFIDGMCHYFLNNYQIQKILREEEGVKPLILDTIHQEYKENIILADTALFKNVDSVKPIIRCRNLKIEGDVHIKNEIDISISGKLYNRSEAQFSFYSQEPFCFDKVSLKLCTLEMNTPALDGRLLELYDCEIRTPLLSPEINCRRSITLKNCSVEKIADKISAKRLFLYNLPELKEISDSLECDIVVIHKCPNLDIRKLRKKFPDVKFEMKHKLDRKLNGSEVSFGSPDSSSIKAINIFTKDS